MQKANETSFAEGGWFKTGDIVRQEPDGRFFIQGRESQDIIKTFGFKVSALEVEREMLSHQSISSAAAVGSLCTTVIPNPLPANFEIPSFKDVVSKYVVLTSLTSQLSPYLKVQNNVKLLRKNEGGNF